MHGRGSTRPLLLPTSFLSSLHSKLFFPSPLPFSIPEKPSETLCNSKRFKTQFISTVHHSLFATMIKGKDIYDVLAAIVPLYVAMLLAYGSVRWWKIFTREQCAGINRFVAVFAVPLLSFHFISSNDPYAMNYRFIAADSLQKIVILVALFIWQTFAKGNSLDWMITLFSLCTLPNTLVMGIPLLKAMYGDFSGGLMVQIVVLQSVIWYTLMLFMFEYRAARALITEQFPETAGSITSFRVESDVVSLNGRDPLQADAEIGDDGKLHVVVRKSTSTRSVVSSYNKSHALNSMTSMTPRASNLTGVEIYSLQSSREPTPRASSFNQTDFYAMFASKMPSPKHGYSGNYQNDTYSLQSSKGVTPRTSNFEEEMMMIKGGGGGGGKHKGGRSMSNEFLNGAPYPGPNPTFVAGSGSGAKKKEGGSKELHMFVWSSSASPVSEGNLKHMVNRAASTDFGALDAKAFVPHDSAAGGLQQTSASASPIIKVGGDREGEIEDGIRSPRKLKPTRSPFLVKKQADVAQGGGGGVDKMLGGSHQMPPASVMTRLILIMVWRKLIRNPNTYSSLLGVVWSLVSYR